MLGKLFKYEFKNTGKLMLTFYGIMIALTFIGMIGFSMINNSSNDSALQGIFLVAYLFLYVIALLALYIVSYVYMCIHFYKTMYTSQGYLTHTLPVSPWANFNVKLVVSFLWLFLNLLLTILSIFGLILAATGASFSEVINALDFQAFSNSIYTEIGMTGTQMIFYLIGGAAISCLSYLLWVYASASIGQLFNQYKVVAGVVTGIIFYFLQQIVSIIIIFVRLAPFQSDIENSIASNTSDGSVTHALASNASFMFSGIMFSIIFCTIFYVICTVVVRKHINLE